MEDDKDSVQETIRYYRMTRTVCRRQSGTTRGQGQCAGDNQVLQENRDSVQETIRYYRRTGTKCRRQ